MVKMVCTLTLNEGDTIFEFSDWKNIHKLFQQLPSCGTTEEQEEAILEEYHHATLWIKATVAKQRSDEMTFYSDIEDIHPITIRFTLLGE